MVNHVLGVEKRVGIRKERVFCAGKPRVFKPRLKKRHGTP